MLKPLSWVYDRRYPSAIMTLPITIHDGQWRWHGQYSIIREWMDRFSWNLACHSIIFKICTFKFRTCSNTNVANAKTCEARWWSRIYFRDSVITHDPTRSYMMTSSHIMALSLYVKGMQFCMQIVLLKGSAIQTRTDHYIFTNTTTILKTLSVT
jgi:hypothetical protein